MISRDAVEQLSFRIERAYCRRNPTWSSQDSCRVIWLSAASNLIEASSESRSIPIDPEMFVAVLSAGRRMPDPRAELTMRISKTRYHRAVRLIIARLRRELRSELRLAEGRLIAGMTLDRVLREESARISALSRYILAYRAGRFDLVLEHQAAAEGQHRACPLYQQASRPYLRRNAYPGSEFQESTISTSSDSIRFSRN